MWTDLFTVGRDAAPRQAGSYQVTDLALAYQYDSRKGDDGKYPMQWIKASWWGERAAKVAEHINKGDKIVATLSGLHIETREHNGKTYTDLVARVENVVLLPKPRAAAPPAPAPKPAPKAPQQQIPQGALEDDDVPF